MILSIQETLDYLGIGPGELFYLVTHGILKREIIQRHPQYRYGFDKKQVEKLKP